MKQLFSQVLTESVFLRHNIFFVQIGNFKNEPESFLAFYRNKSHKSTLCMCVHGRVAKYKKVFPPFGNVFHVYLMRKLQKQFFALPSKSQCGNYISCIFLQSPCQVSRLEKCCQILETLFVVFYHSRNKHTVCSM